MASTCENCGSYAEGQHYGIHYGELIGTRYSNSHNWDSSTTTETKKYQIYAYYAYICDRCATPRIGWIGGLLLFSIGAAVAYFGTQFMTENFALGIGWKPIVFCIIPGIFLILVAISSRVEELRGKVSANENTGEMVAIKCAKKAHRGRGYVFWTSAEYSKLH